MIGLDPLFLYSMDFKKDLILRRLKMDLLFRSRSESLDPLNSTISSFQLAPVSLLSIYHISLVPISRDESA